MNKLSGFTLVELIVVIIILGILSATALPKFIDMSGDAAASSTKAVAASISSWGVMNHGQIKIKGSASAADGTYQINDGGSACAATFGNSVLLAASASSVTTAPMLTGITLKPLVLSTDNDQTFGISGSGIGGCSPGVTIKCIITHRRGQTATAFVPCTN